MYFEGEREKKIKNVDLTTTQISVNFRKWKRFQAVLAVFGMRVAVGIPQRI